MQGSKKTDELSIFIEDFSRNSVFFRTEVKPERDGVESYCGG